MPRVTPLPPDALPPEVARTYTAFAQGYADFADQAAVLAHVPPALDHIYRMLMELRERQGVPFRYIELAVVVVSKLNACPYCVSHHTPLLEVAGVPADAVADLPRADHAAFDAVDRLVIEYTHLVTQRAWGIRDGVFERLRAHFTESQIVELTLRIALCGFFNRFNDALQIDDGAAEALLHLHPALPSSGDPT
ncbi:carboxymuconolactone decarboxylase family protein [Aquabacter spiritensis]|uniref:AhpD family alkylhydroperoxidase n=1 Tax=Aquabacter spiritensis TaxID=933073 RepID=A0A4R3LNE5_9HYPH|nr:carboxymuconolactone decarboxylase family protein [Aquabacter spiritensis]TCT01661.1 AhpD family alkylhydroperoxidase [Aquabacter spiritensis]